jgi:hypothetical protein
MRVKHSGMRHTGTGFALKLHDVVRTIGLFFFARAAAQAENSCRMLLNSPCFPKGLIHSKENPRQRYRLEARQTTDATV